MGLTKVEKTLVSGEKLSNLSIAELTELCFDQQYPQFHHEDRPIGYVAQGMELTLDNFVDMRSAQLEYSYLRSIHEFSNLVGKLLLRRKLEKAELVKSFPDDATPIFSASRQFKSIYAIETGKPREGSWNPYFHIIDRCLVAGTTGQLVKGSKSRIYEVRESFEFPGQDGQVLRRSAERVRFESDYDPEHSPYDYYDDRPDAHTELITDDELRGLLIEWGELDRQIQLEIPAV